MLEHILPELINTLNKKNIKYELINFSPATSETEADNQFNGPKKELARWVHLNADGCQRAALISANHSLNNMQIKKALNARSVNVIGEKLTKENFNEPVIDETLLNGVEEIAFKVNESNTYLKVKTEEIKKITKYKVLDFQLPPTYKAKIDFVSPEEKRNTFEKIDNCFFGVSLENSNFVRPKLMACLEWISNRFSKCTVLIGDSIHRITLQGSRGLEEGSALSEALYLGKKFLHDEYSVFKRFEKKCSFNFVLCSDIQNEPAFKQYHEKLKHLFFSDEIFQNSVKSFGIAYHEKKRDSISNSNFELLIKRSCDYFLEEFAIFASLKAKGIEIMIYP